MARECCEVSVCNDYSVVDCTQDLHGRKRGVSGFSRISQMLLLKQQPDNNEDSHAVAVLN